MQNRMSGLDWNQLKAFWTTAETGSLTAAARQLGLTQPTLSRQVAAIEKHLDVTLFERVGKSVVITESGLALLEYARTMGAAAEELQMVATGQSQAVGGVVKVSATGPAAAYFMPTVLRRVKEAAPLVLIDIVTSDAMSDLMRREADIAIRHMRPQQPDLIGRHLREGSAGFYASKSWVQAHGHPRTAAQAAQHLFVGGDHSGQYLAYLRGCGLQLSAANFACYGDNTMTNLALMRAGIGIGAMMDDIAACMPDLVRVLDDVPPVRFPIWLVTHRELRTSRRIRVVFDILADVLSQTSGVVSGA